MCVCIWRFLILLRLCIGRFSVFHMPSIGVFIKYKLSLDSASNFFHVETICEMVFDIEFTRRMHSPSAAAVVRQEIGWKAPS